MTRSRRLAIAVTGSAVALLLAFLTPHDLRPRAIIAIIAGWSAVVFAWRGNTTRRRVLVVVFAIVITLVSLLAFTVPSP